MNDDATQASTAIIARIMEAMLYANESVAIESVERLKQEISTPFPPSSEPGSPPHLRTGKLWQGIDQETETDGDGVKSVVSSSRKPDSYENHDVPQILEFQLNRPYMTTEFQLIQNGIMEKLKESFLGAMA